MSAEPPPRISLVSCFLTGVGGAGVAFVPCGFAYGVLAGLRDGFDGNYTMGLIAIAGAVVGVGAGFVAGVARYLHLWSRHGRVPTQGTKDAVRVLTVLSLLIAAAPALYFYLS